MIITLSIAHISRKYALPYSSVRTAAKNLFGRTSGYFTEDEIQQIVEKVKPLYKFSGVSTSCFNGKIEDNSNKFPSTIDEADKILLDYASLPLTLKMQICEKIVNYVEERKAIEEELGF